MPRVSDDDAGVAGLRCPGLYRVLLERKCRAAGPDPRSFFIQDDEICRRQMVEADRAADALLAELLAAGEPVAAGYGAVVGGNYGLPRDVAPEHWGRGDWFTVHSDDSIHLETR